MMDHKKSRADCAVGPNSASGDQHKGTPFSDSLMGMGTSSDLLHEGAGPRRTFFMGSFKVLSFMSTLI